MDSSSDADSKRLSTSIELRGESALNVTAVGSLVASVHRLKPVIPLSAAQ